MSEKMVSVEVPKSAIAERYLALKGYTHVYAVRHLDRKGVFTTLEISDRFLNGELNIHFALKENGRTIREIVLTLEQIFADVPGMIADIRAFVIAHGTRDT